MVERCVQGSFMCGMAPCQPHHGGYAHAQDNYGPYRGRQYRHSGDCSAQVCRSEMHWLLGWCRDRRRCGRRRVGVAILRLWLSRVQLRVRLPGLRLRATVRILWRLLRAASLLWARLLPRLGTSNKSPCRIGSAGACRIGDAMHVGSDATDDGRVAAGRYETVEAADFRTLPLPLARTSRKASGVV